MSDLESYEDDFQGADVDAELSPEFRPPANRRFQAAASRAARGAQPRYSPAEYEQMQAKKIQKQQQQQQFQSALESAKTSNFAATAAKELAAQATERLKQGNTNTAAYVMAQQKEFYDRDIKELLKDCDDGKYSTKAEAEKAFKEIQAKYVESGLMTILGKATTTPKHKWNPIGRDSNELKMFKEEVASGKTVTNIPENAEILKQMEAKSNIKMIKLRNYLIKRIRREYGPDIALKVGNPKTTPSPKVEKLINKNSSITDVLNMMSFLINEESEREHIKELSIESGAHDEKGEYLPENEISAGADGTGDVGTWKLSLERKAAPFNLKDLKTERAVGTEIIIPQGIIKRDIDYTASNPITLTDDEIKELFVECVKQLIHIADNTRTVFSGWTKLVQETTGGSSRSKSKTKKKHHHNQDK